LEGGENVGKWASLELFLSSDGYLKKGDVSGGSQTLSAGGSGPTLYAVILSGGGGSVYFQEGANVDLTRSGDTITISSTGSGGGGQTFANTSDATSHTVTLSGGGGSARQVSFFYITVRGQEQYFVPRAGHVGHPVHID
jgi:hypothetical protein